jgi:hypothetical protein
MSRILSFLSIIFCLLSSVFYFASETAKIKLYDSDRLLPIVMGKKEKSCFSCKFSFFSDDELKNCPSGNRRRLELPSFNLVDIEK